MFTVENQKFGFDLTHIDRVILVVEITPFPNAPPYLMGMINIHGAVVPVINLRHVLGLPKRELELNDQFLICRLEGKVFAIWVDLVSGIVEYSKEALIPAKDVISDADSIDYVVKENGAIQLIYNLKKLLPEMSDHVQKPLT